MPSPMMTQFYELKQAYPNDILFFRLGDFYEMFGEDAKLVAPILDLVLTSRKNTIDGNIPMCGVPYHSSAQYIKKLIRAGYSIAICEQQGNASEIKGLVPRKVVKVITPGTALLEGESAESRYIASIYKDKKGFFVAFADLGTGLFETGQFNETDIRDILKSRQVKEVIIPNNTDIINLVQDLGIKVVSESRWNFQLARAEEVLTKHFAISNMSGFGFDAEDNSLIPAGALLSYLVYTQQEDLRHITRLQEMRQSQYMQLDAQTIQNLELFQINRASNKAKSFYQAINYTKTALGIRLLRQWILNPLLDIQYIELRQSHISGYVENNTKRQEVREVLVSIADTERLLARLSSNVGGPRDMLLLNQSLNYIEEILSIDIEDYTQLASKAIRELQPLREELSKALQETVPLLARDGGFVARSYRDDIDSLLDLSQGGKDWLLDFQAREQQRSGINSLKVKYNKVFGYYIEISNAYKQISLPDDYIKKQTLANAERYITPELKEFEEKILASEADLLAQEQIIFEELRQLILQYVNEVYTLSETIAYIDCIQSGAELATQWHYICPQIHDDKDIIIESGRHPVLEQIVSEYIPNNCELTEPNHSLMLITGPNMGGKSTYIRQIALMVLLAQMGYYVPADKAHIGIVDRIFTRVGASDNMGEGQSTFMVEMLEVANILHNATASSLIILDEVGRGTSTYDGMSIARGLIEYIHNTIRARTLFATHYHELLGLESEFKGVVNYQVKIQESNGDIVFLHSIEKGGADKSYGIAIAQLAGFPSDVLELAKKALAQYEQKKSQISFLPSTPNNPIIALHPDIEKYKSLLQDIHSYNLNDITPLDALSILAQLQEKNSL